LGGEGEAANLAFDIVAAVIAGGREVEWAPTKFGMRRVEKGDRGLTSEQQKSQPSDLALPPRELRGELWPVAALAPRLRSARSRRRVLRRAHER
jgi:hypothetical protein